MWAEKKSVRSVEDYVSDQLSNWFNSYTRTTNKYLGRDGNLFKRPFQRKEVYSLAYFKQVVRYVHLNPQHHGLVHDFRLWPYSSYGEMLGNGDALVQRSVVLGRFGGVEGFRAWHERGLSEGDGEWSWEGE